MWQMLVEMKYSKSYLSYFTHLLIASNDNCNKLYYKQTDPKTARAIFECVVPNIQLLLKNTYLLSC